MEDARNAWIDVASKVESLGLKLKLHLEQEASDDVAERVEGQTQNAFEDLSGKLTDAFDAFGNATRDDGVVSDVRDVAELVQEALVETFRAVGAEVAQAMEQFEDYAEQAAEKLAEATGIDLGVGGSDDPIEVTQSAPADDGADTAVEGETDA